MSSSHCCPSLAAMSLLQTLIANLCPCLPVERAGQKELALLIGNRCIAARLGFHFIALLPGSSLCPIHADPSRSHLGLPCSPTHQSVLGFLEGRFHLQLPITVVYGLPVLCIQVSSVVFNSVSPGLPGQLLCLYRTNGSWAPELL